VVVEADVVVEGEGAVDDLGVLALFDKLLCALGACVVDQADAAGVGGELVADALAAACVHAARHVHGDSDPVATLHEGHPAAALLLIKTSSS